MFLLKKGQFVEDIYGNEYLVAKDSLELEDKVLCLYFVNDVANVLNPVLVDKTDLVKCLKLHIHRTKGGEIYNEWRNNGWTNKRRNEYS